MPQLPGSDDRAIADAFATAKHFVVRRNFAASFEPREINAGNRHALGVDAGVPYFGITRGLVSRMPPPVNFAMTFDSPPLKELEPGFT